MYKAVFIRCIGKENDRYNSLIYEYEYKGIKYTVTDHRNGYSQTTKQQHEYEQNKIDSIIEDRNRKKDTNSKPIDINEVYKMMRWDD